ncbi:MAG: histidine phosphatase family protein [Armatimonadota bacterium]|nr:histidine phosphatase family protein [Armatimonadota bacterium]
MTRLLLVRHGETEWNARRRLQGQSDIPLSAEGRRQVEALATIVRMHRPDHAVCSDLTRARATTEMLGYPQARVDARWREADLGAWTGRAIAELVAEDGLQYVAWREGRLTPPAGESWDALCGRVTEALRSLLVAGSCQLVVTHGGPIRAVCAVLLGFPPRRLLPVAPASVTIIDVRDGEARLRAFNLTPVANGEEPLD